MGIIAGVDCHKDSHTIVFVSALGKPLQTVTISADGTGYRRAIAIAKELDDDVIWGLESTGSYGSVFAQELDSSGFVVFEVPGVLTKQERKRSTTRGKSDPIDARAIADTVLRESERLPRYHFSVDREAIRLRYDHRNRMVRERTALINRVRSAAIRLDMQGLPVKFYGQKRLLQLAERLKERRGANMALDAVVDDALYGIEDIVRLEERIKGIEVTLDPLMRRIAPELLEMYGVSIVTAAGFVGHAGDIKNCRNADAFAMRSGVAPVPCSSGRFQGARVNAGGNRQLNRLLYSVALIQIQSKDHVGRVYYDRKRAEGKNYRSAFRCLKRRLATVVYYRLREAQPRLDARQDVAA